MADNNNNAAINNNIHQQKKGFRKLFSEMVYQASKSPKLPRIRSINTFLEGNNFDEENHLDNNNNKTKEGNQQQHLLAATLPKRRSHSTSSTRSLIHRRLQPSLSNKELETIALKYKRTTSTPPLSSRNKHGDKGVAISSPKHSQKQATLRNNNDHSKYKIWSSPPLRFFEDLNTGTTAPVQQSNNNIPSNKSNVYVPTNAKNMDNNNLSKLDYSKTTSRERGGEGSKIKLNKQQSENNNQNSTATQHHRKLTKTQSADYVTSYSTTSCYRTGFEKDEIQIMVRTEVNEVIAQHTKYEKILDQKWSKDICTRVRDHIRLRTGPYKKVIVNSMIGTIIPMNDQENHATCNIVTNIQTDDQFVITVVKSEELFVSVWVFISP